MDRKIRVGAVSYLNTRPLVWGFEQGMMHDKVELTEEYPSKLAASLLDGRIDIGLVPVAVLPLLPSWHIIGDYCIGCDGPVASVCLFSEVPIERIEYILADYQSRSSVALLKLLLAEYWKYSPQLLPTTEGYEKQVSGTTAGLVIGDRALEIQHGMPYVYDLGEAWKAMTGLPFVFAAWVARQPFDAAFTKSFNEACAAGLEHISAISLAAQYPHYDLNVYYSQNIQYRLDDAKRKGLELFLSKIEL